MEEWQETERLVMCQELNIKFQRMVTSLHDIRGEYSALLPLSNVEVFICNCIYP